MTLLEDLLAALGGATGILWKARGRAQNSGSSITRIGSEGADCGSPPKSTSYWLQHRRTNRCLTLTMKCTRLVANRYCRGLVPDELLWLVQYKETHNPQIAAPIVCELVLLPSLSRTKSVLALVRCVHKTPIWSFRSDFEILFDISTQCF
jgi:hypothetical protein